MSTSSQPPEGSQPPAPQPATTPQPPAFPGPPPSTPPPTDGQAIAALILGILGLAGVCPIVGSIIALVMGRSAEKRIEASGGTIGGEGVAKAGWILGLIGIVFGVVVLLFIVAIFALGLAFSLPFMEINSTPGPPDPFGPADFLRWL